MNIDAYLKREGAMKPNDLAAAINVSKGRLSQLRKDGAEWPADLALTAESVTGGALNASHLSSTVARARQTGAAA